MSTVFSRIIKGELPSHKIYEDDYRSLMRAVRKVARHLRHRLDAKRIGMVVEGFAVPHVHVHLIPINQGMEHELCKPKAKMNEAELAAMAQKLRLS